MAYHHQSTRQLVSLSLTPARVDLIVETLAGWSTKAISTIHSTGRLQGQRFVGCLLRAPDWWIPLWTPHHCHVEYTITTFASNSTIHQCEACVYGNNLCWWCIIIQLVVNFKIILVDDLCTIFQIRCYTVLPDSRSFHPYCYSCRHLHGLACAACIAWIACQGLPGIGCHINIDKT